MSCFVSLRSLLTVFVRVLAASAVIKRKVCCQILKANAHFPFIMICLYRNVILLCVIYLDELNRVL